MSTVAWQQRHHEDAKLHGAYRTADDLENQVADQQVRALFGVVHVGVLGAAIAALALTLILVRNHEVQPMRGFAWAGYIAACAIAHILLQFSYRRAARPDLTWRRWAYAFSGISLAEGLGWGWATIALASGNRFDVQLIIMLVSLGVAAGAIPTFGAYLPAFFAIFLPTTAPYVIASLGSADPLRQSTWPLMLVFIAAMSGLGVTANRGFRRVVELRFASEAMAIDLQRQKETAEQASLAKSTFLAAASHDLRQPVHALGLFAGALREIALPPDGRHLVERMEGSIGAMDDLFNALLDISRLDAGIVQVETGLLPIGPLLERVCLESAEEARAKDVGLICKPCHRLVLSDPILVERIARNLVTNAVRYTDRGRVVVGCRKRGSMLAIQVWDTGRGIEDAQRERIFQEYYQVGNPERDRAKGLGLGLAIVRRMADLLEARLVLRSKPGAGSLFEFVVPIAFAAGHDTGPAFSRSDAAPAEGLIVVVDDEIEIRDAMTTLLSRWGYDVVAAASGDDAVARLADYPDIPCLVICDYRLRDGETGIAVVERLRSEYNQSIAAMLVTGDTGPDRLAQAQASGLLLLHKPVSNAKLRAAIANLTAQRATE